MWITRKKIFFWDEETDCYFEGWENLSKGSSELGWKCSGVLDKCQTGSCATSSCSHSHGCLCSWFFPKLGHDTLQAQCASPECWQSHPLWLALSHIQGSRVLFQGLFSCFSCLDHLPIIRITRQIYTDGAFSCYFPFPRLPLSLNLLSFFWIYTQHFTQRA